MPLFVKSSDRLFDKLFYLSKKLEKIYKCYIKTLKK